MQWTVGEKLSLVPGTELTVLCPKDDASSGCDRELQVNIVASIVRDLDGDLAKREKMDGYVDSVEPVVLADVSDHSVDDLYA